MLRWMEGAVVCAAVLALAPAVAAASDDSWTVPSVVLPVHGAHPVVACTADELARLKAAYRGSGPEHDAVASVVAVADRRLGRPIEFPPRGGQHNQWYQCNDCQVALKTVDATHHRCPKCGKVYSGEPYDDVLFSRTHGRNLDAMSTAAWAYAITGEEKYAELAKAVLLGYAERYEEYPYHTASRNPKSRSGGHLFEQTLNEAYSMAGDVAPAYDLIYNSKTLSAEDHRAIREGLIVPMLENIGKYRAGKSNWQTWHNAAMLWGGGVLGDADWVRRAIDDPENGFAYQMKASVSDDGMWYENSWGYHFYTLSAMVRIVEGARRLGIDLWSHPALKKMFSLPVEYAMPDGSLPRLGDDVRTTVGHASQMLEYAYHAYGDPSMLPYLPDRVSWNTVLFGRNPEHTPPPPQPTSRVFPAAGHAILRSDGDARLAAAVTFGPYGGFHGHLDKLSFVFFGRGRELGVDPGRAASQAYRLPIHRDWYKATLGHNAVLVDGKPQAPAAGKLKTFTSGDGYAAVIADCDEAYPGVRQRRLLCLMPEYLLVFDELEADRPHRFDWIYHNRGSAAGCDAVTSDPPPGEACPGWEYVQDARVGVTDETVRVRFADDGVTTHLAMAPAAGSEVTTGDGVGRSVFDRVPLVRVSRQGSRATFAATLEPVEDGRTAPAASLTVTPDDAGTRIAIRRGDATDVVRLSSDGKVTVSHE